MARVVRKKKLVLPRTMRVELTGSGLHRELDGMARQDGISAITTIARDFGFRWGLFNGNDEPPSPAQLSRAWVLWFVIEVDDDNEHVVWLGIQTSSAAYKREQETDGERNWDEAWSTDPRDAGAFADIVTRLREIAAQQNR